MSALLNLDQDKFNAVIRWRQAVGGRVNGAWAPERKKGHHLIVIFGRRDSDEPLRCGGIMSLNHHPSDPMDGLMVRATTLWHQPHGTRVLGLYDLDDPYADFRAVIVTTKPMDGEETDRLYSVLRHQIPHDFPDILLNPPAI